MIRKYEEKDLEWVISIWYESILDAHSFIDSGYWYLAKERVIKDYLPKADTFVYEEDRIIKGFISIVEDESIWAIFVEEGYRRQGIADNLIKHVQEKYDLLTVSIYKKNESAMWVFRRNDFEFEHTQIDVNTNQPEMLFVWRK